MMKVIRNRKRVALAFLTFFNTGVLVAGPFRPAEEAGGSDAISLNSEAITAWAAEVISYQPGEEVDPVWQVPETSQFSKMLLHPIFLNWLLWRSPQMVFILYAFLLLL